VYGVGTKGVIESRCEHCGKPFSFNVEVTPEALITDTPLTSHLLVWAPSAPEGLKVKEFLSQY